MKYYMSRDDINLGRPFKARKRVWAKIVEKVDTTKDNGYAFQGKWLRVRGDPAFIDDSAPVGSYIVATSAEGSTNHPRTGINLFKVTESGLEEVWSGYYDTKKEMHEAVMAIAEIINQEDNETEIIRNALQELINKYSIEKVEKVFEELKEK